MSTHRGVVIRFLSAVALATLSAALPNRASAETIFFGPTPYLSAADSPFDLSGLGTTFFLEDFEDGELNTPGVLPTSLDIIGPNFDRDSVDGDDGVIDGVGLEGHSARTGLVCTDGDPPACVSSAIISFDAEELGWLPTAVGIVWTDGWNTENVVFAVTNANGNSFSRQGFFLGDDNFLGGTAEDRFFGAVDPHGIAFFGLGSRVPFEVDHLQYGLFIPEPTASGLLLLGLPIIFLAPRRR